MAWSWSPTAAPRRSKRVADTWVGDAPSTHASRCHPPNTNQLNRQLTQTPRRNIHHDHHQHHRLGQHGQRHRHPGNEARPHRRDHEPRHRQGSGTRCQIGDGATVGTFGTRPAGDIVIVAVLYASAVDVVAHFGDALAGKILVDITNPFNADVTGLVTTAGNSVSQQIAAVAPEGTRVVKAFNTILRGVLAEHRPLDAFFAGDSAEAKTHVAALLESMDLRPLDAGGLEMTYALEWASILLVGLASNGAGFDLALGAEVL